MNCRPPTFNFAAVRYPNSTSHARLTDLAGNLLLNHFFGYYEGRKNLPICSVDRVDWIAPTGIRVLILPYKVMSYCLSQMINVRRLFLGAWGNRGRSLANNAKSNLGRFAAFSHWLRSRGGCCTHNPQGSECVDHTRCEHAWHKTCCLPYDYDGSQFAHSAIEFKRTADRDPNRKNPDLGSFARDQFLRRRTHDGIRF